MNLERNKENKDFIMLYRSFIDDITKLAGENYTAYRIFQFICKNMDYHNALCISNIALSELLNISTRTVIRSIKYLKEHGWICVLKSGTSNVYIINPDIAWTSYADEKKYCKFQANVLLSSTENNEFLNNPKAINRYKNIDTDFIKSVIDKKEEFKQYAKKISQNENENQTE